jgi:hypothetical protein
VLLADGSDAFLERPGRPAGTARAVRPGWPRPRPPGWWSNRSLVTGSASPASAPPAPMHVAGLDRRCAAQHRPAGRGRRRHNGRPLRQARRSRHLQARYGFYPLGDLLGLVCCHRRGLERDPAAGQRRLQHRRGPHRRHRRGAGATAQRRARPAHCDTGRHRRRDPRLHRPPAPAGCRVLDQPAGRRARPRCWPWRPMLGSQRSTPTASPDLAPRSPSW